MRCGATSKQSGQRCKRWASKGKRVCRTHGGATPTGPVLPQFKSGIYSRALPNRLAERYMEALDDPELIEQRRETAVLQAMVEQCMSRLDTGESAAHWDRLQLAWAQYVCSKNDAECDARIRVLGDLIRDGGRLIEAERELRAAILTKMKVAESERKRLVEVSQMITAEELTALVAGLASAINQEVSDRETRQRIIGRFTRLVSAGS